MYNLKDKVKKIKKLFENDPEGYKIYLKDNKLFNQEERLLDLLQRT